MTQPRQHDDRLEVTPDLVRRLLAAQAPALAHLPIRSVASTGTVNALFRVGDDAVVRLPIMREWSDPQAERATLERIAPAVRTRIPRVLLVGEPAEGYPQRWLVLDWIAGRPAAPGAGGAALADDLADFLDALWLAPCDNARAGYRVALDRHDRAVRDSLAAASDVVDVPVLTALWDDALAAPGWVGPLRWTHSDLLSGNVLLDGQGRLAAVIDWEAAGTGDPACDLMAAWSMLDRAGRARMRDRLPLDADAWRRGRGWALAQAIIALPYYRHSNPGLVAHSRHVLDTLVADGRSHQEERR